MLYNGSYNAAHGADRSRRRCSGGRVESEARTADGPLDYVEQEPEAGYLRVLLPTARGGFLSNLFPLLGRHASRPRLTAHAAQGHGGGILAVVGGHILDLARRNLGDYDGAGVHVSGALFALGTPSH